jgi:hypothetical protein
MAEAPPNRPGHVGHTPQDVVGMLRRSRLAGLETTNVPAQLAARGQTIAGQQFRQLQRFSRGSSMEALARVVDYSRRVRLGGVDPAPLDFLAGYQDPKLTRQRQTP